MSNTKNNYKTSYECNNCGERWELLIKDASNISYKNDKMIVYSQCPVCKHTNKITEENKNDR